jgi:hypothetical protein
MLKLGVGEKFLTKCCGWCKVLNFKSKSDIVVEFEGDFACEVNTTWKSLKRGEVRNPKQPKPQNLITDDWNQLFYYSEDSPSGLFWKVKRYTGKNYSQLICEVGDLVGFIDKSKGYWRTLINNTRKLCHVVIWEMFNGKIEDERLVVDHIDGNPLNNKIENLRLVEKKINGRNIRKMSTNTSGVTGVSLMKTQKTGQRAYFYYQAFYKNSDGKQKSKCFSFLKLGEEEAFKQACEWREEMIREMNLQGAGYTERHGK